MTPKQIQLVQQSWKRVEPVSNMAAALLYERLFQVDPGLRRLFKRDLREQGQRLMQLIGAVVANLSRPESVLPALQAFGHRHAEYGMTDAYYATMGEALLWTLRRGLGDVFDTQTRAAWSEAYTVLAETMKAAAHESLQSRALAA